MSQGTSYSRTSGSEVLPSTWQAAETRYPTHVLAPHERIASNEATPQQGEDSTKLGNTGNAAEVEGATGEGVTSGSDLHKEARWQEYQANNGTWSYDRWSNVYDANMTRASAANEAVDAYHQTLGWGQREVTVNTTVDGVNYARRLDIADVLTQRGIEYKTGYQSANQDNLWEVARDQSLVQRSWEIHWVFRDTPSQPLLNALDQAGIRYTISE